MKNRSYNEWLLLQHVHLHVYHIHYFVHDEDELGQFDYVDDLQLVMLNNVKN